MWTSARLSELKQRPSRPERYVLTLVADDGLEARVTVSDEFAIRTGLREGVALGSAELVAIGKEAGLVFARDKALGALARRSRSRREIELMLQRQGVGSGDIQQVVAGLTRAGHLDDARVAAAFVRSRMASSGASVWLLRRDLARKGIARDTADEAISAVMSEESVSEAEVARREAEKKMRSLARLERNVARRRLAAHLQRRGFSGSVVSDLVRELTMGGDGGRP